MVICQRPLVVQT